MLNFDVRKKWTFYF